MGKGSASQSDGKPLNVSDDVLADLLGQGYYGGSPENSF